MSAFSQPADATCGCGCGAPAPTSKRTSSAQGIVKGEPLKFIAGHNARGTRRTPRAAKMTLRCEACGQPFEVYASKIAKAKERGVAGPRFCSSACFESTRTGPKCSKCGGPNTRGRRYRVCQVCLDTTPAALKIARARERLAECPADKRWCNVCDEFLPPGQFSTRVVGTENLCAACKAKRQSSRHLARDFGINDAQYDAMLASQGGVCAICRRPPKKVRLHIDHNHKTGQIRGLLCSWCNHRLLSGARDSLDILRNAVSYLETPPAVPVIGEAFVPKNRRKR